MTTTIDHQMVDAERSGAAHRISGRPGWTVDFDCGQVSIDAPDVPDSNDPEYTFDGGIGLDLAMFGLDDNDEPAVEDAAAVVLAAEIVSSIHEVAEWLRVDGNRLFATHLTDCAEWDMLAGIACDATNRLVAEHPRGPAPITPNALTHTPQVWNEQTRPVPSVEAADLFELPGTSVDLVSLWPGVAVDQQAGEVYMSKNEMVPDANDLTRTIDADLILLANSVGLPDNETDQVDGRTAARAVAVTAITDHLHELAEWIRVDGQRLFAPHPPSGDLDTDEMASFDVCSEIAAAAVDALFDRHARPTYRA